MITAKEAIKEHKNLKSYWSVETRLSQKILIAILEHFEAAAVRKPRKPTAWQAFLSKQIKAGFTMQEAAKKWRERPKVKSAVA